MIDQEKIVVKILLDLARAAYEAMDNSCEKSETSDVLIPMEDAVAICNALDALDGLPDDRPGYTLSPNAKAAWALREIIPEPDPA
jgi:hypothetical protein